MNTYNFVYCSAPYAFWHASQESVSWNINGRVQEQIFALPFPKRHLKVILGIKQLHLVYLYISRVFARNVWFSSIVLVG